MVRAIMESVLATGSIVAIVVGGIVAAVWAFLTKNGN